MLSLSPFNMQCVCVCVCVCVLCKVICLALTLSSRHRSSPPAATNQTTLHLHLKVPLRNVVFGFPYLDTLKLNGRPELGGGVIFYGNGDDADIANLSSLLESGERIGGLFCEFPSNPLLRAPPLRKLRKLADRFKFPIVVDDSISGFCNVDVLQPGEWALMHAGPPPVHRCGRRAGGWGHRSCVFPGGRRNTPASFREGICACSY